MYVWIFLYAMCPYDTCHPWLTHSSCCTHLIIQLVVRPPDDRDAALDGKPLQAAVPRPATIPEVQLPLSCLPLSGGQRRCRLRPQARASFAKAVDPWVGGRVRQGGHNHLGAHQACVHEPRHVWGHDGHLDHNLCTYRANRQEREGGVCSATPPFFLQHVKTRCVTTTNASGAPTRHSLTE